MGFVFVESVGKMDKKQVYEYIVKLGHEAFYDDFGFEVFEECDVVKEIVRCKDCEMCKEYEIYDDKGNVEKVELRCTRPIMFLEKGGVSMQEMLFGSCLNGMNVVLQNVKPNDFCSWGKKQ